MVSTQHDRPIEVLLGPELFRFDSVESWIVNGKSWYAECEAPSWRTVAIDSAGRIIVSGAGFRMAKETGAYPVIVYDIRTRGGS